MQYSSVTVLIRRHVPSAAVAQQFKIQSYTIVQTYLPVYPVELPAGPADFAGGGLAGAHAGAQLRRPCSRQVNAATICLV